MKRACIATSALVAALLITTVPVQAQGIQIIEDFEDIASGTGDWVISNSNSITVSLGLNLDTPIVGVKDLSVDLGLGLLGANYTISNSNLNVPVPDSAEEFSFKIKPLLALNLARNVVVTLYDQNDVSYESEVKSLGLLSLGTVTDLNFALDSFDPPIGSGVTAINGVDLKFTTTLASVQAEEHIDELRLLWDTSAVSDWMCY